MNLGNFQKRIEKAQESETKPRSQRAELIGMFLEKLKDNHLDENGNHKTYIGKDGKKKKVQPMTAARLGVMLSTIKSTSDLRAFLGECSAAKDFAKYYFWRFKK